MFAESRFETEKFYPGRLAADPGPARKVEMAQNRGLRQGSVGPLKKPTTGAHQLLKSVSEEQLFNNVVETNGCRERLPKSKPLTLGRRRPAISQGGIHMLVLSRKIGQEITIGSDVRVVVHRISGNRVTVGIEAPREVSILRGELKPLTNSHLEPKEPTSSLLLPDFMTKDDSNYTDLPRSPR